MSAIRVREDYRSLTGPEKAAVLMLALGEEHAARLFVHMDEEEIKELSQTMANLGTISATLVERLCVEFAEQLSSTGTLVGTYDSTERLLLKVMDREKVDAIMEEIRGPAGRTMWEKLANVNEAVLANYLKNEYPQTVAVVLSKIRPDHGARVLALLPESFAMEVVMRMLRMEAVQKDVLDDVERTLRTEFMTNLARTNRRDSHEMMAEIFNNLDRQTEKQVPCRAGGTQPRQRRADQGADVHLRGPGETGPDRGADPAACGRQGQAGDRPQGRVREPARAVLLQHVGARRQADARGDGRHGSGPPEGR